MQRLTALTLFLALLVVCLPTLSALALRPNKALTLSTNVVSSRGSFGARINSRYAAGRGGPLLIHTCNKMNSATSLHVFPQLVFAAGCAGAVFWYVATHIDEIKEQQGRAVAAAQQEQSSNVRSAQETQRLAIEKVKQQQEENARRAKQIAEDAQKRANEGANRR